MRNSNVQIVKNLSIIVALSCSSIIYYFPNIGDNIKPSLLVLLIMSILAISYFAYERGYNNVFENPKSEYSYGVNGSWLKEKVNNYVFDEARSYQKNWNKMLDINERDSETFKTFEKEALCQMLDDIYTLYKVCLAVNADFEKSQINAIFVEAITREFPENSINRLIVSAARAQILKEFKMI